MTTSRFDGKWLFRILLYLRILYILYEGSKIQEYTSFTLGRCPRSISITRLAPRTIPAHIIDLQEDSMSSAIFSANASTESLAQSLLLLVTHPSTTHRSCSSDGLAAE